MKVLKSPPEFKPIELTCNHCKASLLGETPKDFKRIIYSDQRGDSDDYAVVFCPCCGYQVRAEKSLFPNHIYLALEIHS